MLFINIFQFKIYIIIIKLIYKIIYKNIQKINKTP